MEATKEAIIRFMENPLKHPTSKAVLKLLLENDQLLSNATFVVSREMLPNTLLVTQQGVSGVGFELELGVEQFEEVSIVNGRLVRNIRKTSRLCVHSPEQALGALKQFSGKLYIELGFSGRVPYWYKKIVSPNPALAEKESTKKVNSILDEVISDQLDLALWTIVLRDKVERSLLERDESTFLKYVGLYNKVSERCLWEFD